MDGDNPVDATLTTGATFKINNAKLYVPVVTLPINDLTWPKIVSYLKYQEHIK